jgi:uroporphyrin-III C-methyltransferase
MFGRAAEERAFLEAQGVSVEVIAGVTTASAAAAQFGFSLTERNVARRVLFATGRTLTGAEIDWRAACDAETTLCLYMGCADSAAIAEALVEGGRSPSTPVLILWNVEQAGSSYSALTLRSLLDGVKSDSSGPAIILVGAAVGAVAKRVAQEASFGLAQTLRDTRGSN